MSSIFFHPKSMAKYLKFPEQDNILFDKFKHRPVLSSPLSIVTWRSGGLLKNTLCLKENIEKPCLIVFVKMANVGVAIIFVKSNFHTFNNIKEIVRS